MHTMECAGCRHAHRQHWRRPSRREITSKTLARDDGDGEDGDDYDHHTRGAFGQHRYIYLCILHIVAERTINTCAKYYCCECRANCSNDFVYNIWYRMDVYIYSGSSNCTRCAPRQPRCRRHRLLVALYGTHNAVYKSPIIPATQISGGALKS